MHVAHRCGCDALEAARSGAGAIVVSNHGGRQLDQAPSTAVALKHVCAALHAEQVALRHAAIKSGTCVRYATYSAHGGADAARQGTATQRQGKAAVVMHVVLCSGGACMMR